MFVEVCVELKRYFYQSAGGFKKRKKKKRCSASTFRKRIDYLLLRVTAVLLFLGRRIDVRINSTTFWQNRSRRDGVSLPKIRRKFIPALQLLLSLYCILNKKNGFFVLENQFLCVTGIYRSIRSCEELQIHKMVPGTHLPGACVEPPICLERQKKKRLYSQLKYRRYYYGGPWLIGPMAYIKSYIFNHFY